MEFMFALWKDHFPFLLLKEIAVFENCLVKSVGGNDIMIGYIMVFKKGETSKAPIGTLFLSSLAI